MKYLEVQMKNSFIPGMTKDIRDTKFKN